MFKEEIYDIYNELDNINARIDSLCNAVNTNIASLQTIIDVMQDNDYVESITPIVEGGETVGYEIVFTQSGSVKIYHGKKGETGHTPIVGVQQAEDGRWYWTIDGEWLLDGEGDKVLAEAIDGIDGEKGEEGITPKLEVRDNYWYISYDNGATWVQLGKATGENGKDGDSMFKSISYNEDYVELVLADGKTVIKIPTWASHMLLVDEIAKINNNISAIQAAVKALESNDYVQKVTPVKDEDGNVIGYTLQFAFTGDVTIYHGEDGKDGEDGEDGKDGVDGEDGKDGKDGYTPVIGARQHPDGNWYWTVDTEWLLDTNGNKVKTTGEDGTSGITPELKIEDDYWYVSYDKGQTWTKLGKAKGEDGADGEGKDGDSFFKDVNVTEDYVTFTLANGTEIKIPTWKVYQELADAVAHLNTNVQSMQTIIAAIQNNDFVTGTTEIVDHQTNEVIGYKLHFSKSGDIEIYHGKTPNAPKIGIKKHPQYGNCWAYNDQYIYDEAGKPVALPQDGSDAIAPKFKIEGGRWWMSTDGGDSWDDIGQATGDQGQQGETGATGGTGDSFFKNVKSEYATDSEGNVLNDKNGKPIVAYIVLTLSDNSEYRVPTAYITDELTKRIAAIEGEFATIQTIVTALQNAEYIKEITPHYTDLVLDGYDIKFVKYTLLPNGELDEKYRDVSIRNGGAGAAGTVVGVEADPKTGELYWTLNGEPLYHDGKLVPVTGKTPEIAIKDGYWYINGENTGIKAEGTDGNDGDDGTDASSLFSDVVLNEDGYYEFIFTNNSRPPIKVPSWIAFENLQKAVLGLQTNVQTLETLVYGNKYIESIVAHEDGKGYDITIKYYDPETKEEKTETHKLYITTADEIGVMMNPEDNKYYWTKGGEWLLDADGNKVEVAAERTLVFKSENDGKLYYKYSDEGENAWKVLDISVSDTTIESNIIVTKDDDTGKITVTIKDDEGKTVGGFDCPSWDAYLKLQNAVTSLTINVETISALVYGHKYVESFKELENGGYEFVVRYYDETAKEWKTETHTIDVTTADEIGVKQDTDGNYYWTKGGEWLLDANGEKVKVAAERTLQFKSENDGKLYYKYSDEGENDWKEINIAVSDTTIESNIIVDKDEVTGKVTVTIKDDEGRVVNGFEAPMWSAYEKLLVRMETVEGLVATIQEDIAGLSASLETLSEELAQVKENQNKYLTSEEFDTWKSETNFVQNVALDGDILKITVVNGNGENPEEIEYPINHPVSTYKNKDGELYWLINGKETEYPVETKPKFQIDPVSGNLQFSINGSDWTTLESASNAVKVVFTNDPYPTEGSWVAVDAATALWAGIFYSEDNIIWMPTYKNFSELESRLAMVAADVEAIHGSISDINGSLESLSEQIAALEGVQGNYLTSEAFKAWKDGARFVQKVTKDGDVWSFVVADGNGNAIEGAGFDITATPDVSTYEKDGVLYWVINGKVTEYPVETKPKFQVDDSGRLQFSMNGKDWTTLESASNAVKVVFTNNPYPTEGTWVAADAATALWAGIYYSEENIIWMPTYKNFNELVARVNVLESNINALSTFVNDKSFISNIETITDKETGKVIGFDATVMKFKAVKGQDGKYTYSNEPENAKISYRHGYSVSVIEENGNKYWVINGDETNKILVHDPYFVPQIHVDGEGMVYISISPDATVKDLSNTEHWVKINPNDTIVTEKDAVFTPVLENGVVVGYEIAMYDKDGNKSTITVPAYLETPIIEFDPTTLNLGTDDEGEVTCTIKGSFGNNAPEITVSCEGLYTSTVDTPTTTDDGYKFKITVYRTVSYAGANMAGKLTVMVPYYGTTIVKQLDITANAPSLTVQNINADKTSLTYSLENISDDKKKISFIFEPKVDWIKGTSYDDNGNPVVNLLANTTKDTRKCTITALLPNGMILDKRTINQLGYNNEDENASGNGITDLAELESANCYIISAGGTYMFPTVKGNSNTALTTIHGLPEVIWSDNANNFEFVSATSDYIVFRVGSKSTVGEWLNTVADGNTLIGVKDKEGKILWSWHIWFSTVPPSNQIDPYTGAEMINQDLGDSALGDGGLYYQWGRKDPLPYHLNKYVAGTGAGDNGDNAILNPYKFYIDWTEKNGSWDRGSIGKSINDPCPPGYRIPSNDSWVATKQSSMSVRAGQYFNYGAATTGDISYGFYQNIGGNGKLTEKSNKIEERDKTSTRDFGITVDITYDRDSYIVHGGAWGIDAPMFYNYRQVEANSFKTKKLYIHATKTEFDIEKRDSWGWLKKLAFAAYEYLLEDAVSQLGTDQIEYTNKFDKSFNTNNGHDNDYYKPVNGYKVRCVKEVKE